MTAKYKLNKLERLLFGLLYIYVLRISVEIGLANYIENWISTG